ncbi:neural Wiskott-Aldrich syndrome protein-like [Schistocerca piceifrons]|uniref:neural Wiskott-Aldrich syndrome protein-like n=1 Tax=Schistocerca piceifrons TaxID=274613 RepID=UPI001F5EEA75|nr:neural Wiskott-Aldrich syndrome protein-like [Schistocerca piceifrons]
MSISKLGAKLALSLLTNRIEGWGRVTVMQDGYHKHVNIVLVWYLTAVYSESSTHSQNAIKVQGEPNYNSEINLPLSVCKRGKHLGHTNSSSITNTVVPINEKKLEDVSKLLEKHYSESWRERESLSWFMTLLGTSGSGAPVESECLTGEDEDIVPGMMAAQPDGPVPYKPERPPPPAQPPQAPPPQPPPPSQQTSRQAPPPQPQPPQQQAQPQQPPQQPPPPPPPQQQPPQQPPPPPQQQPPQAQIEYLPPPSQPRNRISLLHPQEFLRPLPQGARLQPP